MRSLAGLVATATLLVLCGCNPGSAELIGVERSDFPVDLEPPRLSGTADAAVGQLCEWARQGDVEFDPAILEAVYVQSLHGIAGLREYVVSNFLMGPRRTQRLALELSPNDFAPYRRVTENMRATGTPSRYHEQRLALYEEIDRSAVWSFERLPRSFCENPAAGGVRIPVEADAELCVRILRLEEAPHQYTRLDFRVLNFEANLLGVRQDMTVRIASLYRGDSLAGRTINASAHALPIAIGHVGRVCSSTPLFGAEG